ncbi:winged helix-turn-helix transcriptional regulator [Streptomyces huiliensis]|uniref:winged helix-turn-helix transcriptional regulator n=1 Tax=Streptomyces huiliensis TaxID=2876027 RepID=UPI0021DF96B5|nr:response regulator transcription factor [Streptomyces huiliensis]MBZ4323788.1 response regulator transcription factor [Streptomyces huiliensis]
MIAERSGLLMRFLLVQDTIDATNALARELEYAGHAVQTVFAAEAERGPRDVDVVLMDVTRTCEEAYLRCGRLRRLHGAPVVVLDCAPDELSCVTFLRCGADDHMAKPYRFWELTARAQKATRAGCAGCRGQRPDPVPAAEPASATGATGLLQIDERARQASFRGDPLRLTRKEFDLLRFLHEARGSVCTREEIIARLWGDNWYGSERTVDVHVSALRRKLGDPSVLATVRGVGFRLGEPAVVAADPAARPRLRSAG